MSKIEKIQQAKCVLHDLGLPRSLQNDRSAYVLLALGSVKPESAWSDVTALQWGITPIMEFISQYYGFKYAPNSRETIRRQTIHQFLLSGLVHLNPDNPSRSVNSMHTVYQLTMEFCKLLTTIGLSNYHHELSYYVINNDKLRHFLTGEPVAPRYRGVKIESLGLELSTGSHSTLIKSIIEVFAMHFIVDMSVLYIGDTANKVLLTQFGLFPGLESNIDLHGKLPDVVLMDSAKGWIFLIEAVTSHGPMDSKRILELTALFRTVVDRLVFVTAFADMKTYIRYAKEIAWETEVWIAETPSHLIHYNGDRFMGPR